MCTLVDLGPLAIVAFTLSRSIIVYGPTHRALSLHDLTRGAVSSKSKTLSPTCSFVGPAVFS